MTCGEMKDVLPGLAEREGTPRVALEAARHLARCFSCADSLLRLRAMNGLLDRLPEVDVPQSFTRRVLRAIPRGKRSVGVCLIILMALSWLGASGFEALPLRLLVSPLLDPIQTGLSILDAGWRILLGLAAVARDALGETPTPMWPLDGSAHSVLHQIALPALFAAATLVSSCAAFARGMLGTPFRKYGVARGSR